MAERRQDRHCGPEGTFLSAKTYSLPSSSTLRVVPGSIDTTLAGEASSSLGGVAVCVEGDLGLGAAFDLMNSLGGAGHVGHDRSKAARRGDDAHIAMRQTSLVELLHDELRKLLGSVDQAAPRASPRCRSRAGNPEYLPFRPPRPSWNTCLSCQQPRRDSSRSRPWRRRGRAGCSWRARSPRWRRVRRGC